MAVSNLVPAASGPTLAEITSSIQTNASPFNGTWTNLYANTPGTGVGTLTVSGLSSYKYIRVGWNDVGCSSAGNNFQIRLNSDSGSNYYDVQGYSSQTAPYIQTPSMGSVSQFNFRRCDANGGLGNTGQFDIYGSNNTSSYKVLNNVQHVWYDGSQQLGLLRRVSSWHSTAAVSSITFYFVSGNFTSTSKIFVDGAN